MNTLFDRALEAHIVHEAEATRARQREAEERVERARQMQNDAREQTREFIANKLAPEVDLGSIRVATSKNYPMRVVYTRFFVESREFKCSFGFDARSLKCWPANLYLVCLDGKERHFNNLQELGALLAKETEPSAVSVEIALPQQEGGGDPFADE